MDNFKPKDYIAILTILIVFILKYLGHNGTLDIFVGGILGYYFVKRQNGLDNGK